MTDTILIVDDDLVAIRSMGRILGGLGRIQFACSGTDALRLVRESMPALILLDGEMPGMSGFAVCEALKADAALAHIPVIFVTSHVECEFEVAGFELGAVDFIAKPVSPPLLVARVKTQLRIKHLTDALRHSAATDALTQIANRRSFDESMRREWSRARRSGEALSVLMIDVDHFKLFNDRYGHGAGDRCLQAVAQALVESSLRPADLAARYGGEEFVMLLPVTDRTGAAHVAARVLEAVARLQIEHAASSTAGHVTVSVGLASYDEQSDAWTGAGIESRLLEGGGAPASPMQMLRAADKALYVAKHAGRAQAWMLDVADVEVPDRASPVQPVQPVRGPALVLELA